MDKQIEEIETTQKAIRKSADREGAMVDLLNQEMKELQASQKQVAELAKVLCPSYENKKDCETCPTEWCQAEEYAVMAICNGYRKIHEGAVVLKKAELAQIQSNFFDSGIKHGSKETAEKFAERLKEKLMEWLEDNEGLDGKIDFGIAMIELIGVKSLDGEVIAESLIDKIAKEITEGEV
jgi:hypothetical protein